ncbi:hypothetical protein STCU_08530 [Strigomonas culicis]|nr:hypothetical protein STCU_08530 [Strigomonas culicis]|eukprot:EPY21473.1 hypothetical protein STCU_08530 [Strigomonas culicis]
MAARQQAGYVFEAFVYSLLHVRPLLREQRERGQLSSQEATRILAGAEDDIAKELGVSGLSQDIELWEYRGGVDMVSRGHFKANDVLFVEKQYTSDLGESELNSLRDLTTEKIAAHFATHLRTAQEANTADYVRFRQQFHGAWPRDLSEVSDETQQKVGSHLRTLFPDLAQAPFDELLTLSLMCRYNCFHSGFFRVCALANHNCQANIAMKYSPRDHTVTMIAVSDIKPGEMLNVKYLGDAHFLMGLGKRREFLRSWLFWCGCGRCAQDALPAALQEYMRCPQCAQYTHMPVPGDTNADADPLLPLDVTCAHCQASFHWDDAHRQPFRELLARYMTSSFPDNARALATWADAQLSHVRALKVHPVNWIYRIVFYFLCLPLTSLIVKAVEQVRQPRGTPALRDVADLFGENGLRKHYIPLLAELQAEERTSPAAHCSLLDDAILSSETGGCDALKSLVVIWHLIKDFYPPYEMWSIHAAICNLVCLQLLFQSQPGVRSDGGPLSSQHALTLLQRHGPYIGTDGESKWLQLYNMYRAKVADPKNLPNLTKVKAAFHTKR